MKERRGKQKNLNNLNIKNCTLILLFLLIIKLMAHSMIFRSPLNLLKSPGDSLDLFLRFIDSRLKQKYFNYVHERSLTIIKILDLLIILGSATMIGYFLISLASNQGYEALSFKLTIILTAISFIVTLTFIGLSIWLHYFKLIYSDLLLCVINTFSVVFLFEINVNNPALDQNPTLYFSYCYRFGLMNLMFVICYKTWFLKVFQVCFGSIYFQIRLSFTDPWSIAYNMILTAFCCFLFYFLEKQDKLAFKKMIESEKQNKSWKKILNTFPEGIAISKEDKNLVFINNSLKQLLNENEEENLKQVLFFQLKKKNPPNNSLSKFSSRESYQSANALFHNITKDKEDKELTLNEIFEAYANKMNAHQSLEKLERQKSFKLSFTGKMSMKVPKIEKNKFETFLSKLNDKFLEIKISTFTYESTGNAYIIIISDISENLKLRMLEDNKAFKNSLFASFTHEFRTPLNAFFLLSKTLLLQDSISETIKNEIIDPIVFNAEILHNLINTISDFVSINMQTFKLQKSILKFKDFMIENIKILSCLAKARDLKTELKLGRTLPDDIYTDENRIKQILFQFYSNALKFTTSGSIKVSAKVSKSSKDRIIISVKDTGIGMNEKDMGNLYRVINQHIDYMNYERIAGSAGASLGLTISNKIAKKLDKKPSSGIGFKNVFGKGMKFFFGIKNTQSSKKVSHLNLLRLSKTISLKKDGLKLGTTKLEVYSVENQSNLNSHENEEDGGRVNFSCLYKFPNARFINNKLGPLEDEKTMVDQENEKMKDCDHEPILIVDDDEFNIMAVTMLLKMNNMKCLAARNGELAIELIEEQCKIRENCCKRFSLILMDLNMPVLNGIEASKQLNQRFEENRLPWMPIVMCTAYGNDQALEEKFDSGIVEVVHKPIKFEVLRKVIEKWMKI